MWMFNAGCPQVLAGTLALDEEKMRPNARSFHTAEVEPHGHGMLLNESGQTRNFFFFF